MTYIILTFLSGVFSGLISMLFRAIELKKKTILFGKQMILQVVIFVGFAFIFQNYFSFYTLDTGFFTFNWFWIFFIVSSLSYYMVQVTYEWQTGNELFPTPDEIERLLEEKMRNRK